MTVSTGSLSASSISSDSRVEVDLAADASSVLSVRDLTTTFTSGGQRIDALRGIDLDLYAGRVSVLLGESGSGKSVTARSILRLYGASAVLGGSVMFEGRDLIDLDESEMQPIRGSGIALVPQDPTGSLDPVRRVGAQIIEVLKLHGMVESKKEGKARAEELLGLVGLPDPQRAARSFPHEMSGGMKQRVAIALAICCDPTLLIADEPTTALDVTVQAQILDLFIGLTASTGSAMLMITHDVGVAKDLADHVSVMYAGRIVEQGPTEAVLVDPVHPYTKALLRAVPKPNLARGSLIPIIGQPPVSGMTLPGCSFAPRCPAAQPSCTEEIPELVSVGTEHTVACPIATESGGS